MSNNDIQKAIEDIHEITSEIFKINANQECTGCRYFDLDKDDFDEKCTLCARFHEDYFEVKKDES